jgi:DNA topoisomerase-3
MKAIRDAPRTARRVWLATDCDREEQLIGQEILEHYAYCGMVMLVMFSAQDPQSIRHAFARAERGVWAPLRRRGPAAAGRPDLQPVVDPHRHRHARLRRAHGHRREADENPDRCHRLQARTGNPQFRFTGLF